MHKHTFFLFSLASAIPKKPSNYLLMGIRNWRWREEELVVNSTTLNSFCHVVPLCSPTLSLAEKFILRIFQILTGYADRPRCSLFVCLFVVCLLILDMKFWWEQKSFVSTWRWATEKKSEKNSFFYPVDRF